MEKRKLFARVVYREFGRIVSKRIYFAVLVIIPIFTIFFLATIFGNGEIEKIPVGVVNYNSNKLSRQITEKLNASPKLETYSYMSEKEAHQALQKLEIYGYLLIPPDFGEQLYSGKRPPLTYYYQKSVLATGEEVNGAFFSVLSNLAASLTVETAESAGVTSAQSKAVVVPIEELSYPLYNTNLDFITYITYPFIFVFLQILLIVLIVYVIDSEKGSDQWLRCSGQDAKIAILGKVFPYFIIFSIYTLITNLVCFNLLHIPIGRNLILLSIVGILLITASIAIGITIALTISNFSIAISIASMYGALGATMCGVTFPVEQMGLAVHAASALFPIRHFIHLYHNIVYLDLPLTDDWTTLVSIAIFIALPFAIGLKRLKRVLENKSKFSRLPSIYGVLLIAIGGTVGYSMLYNVLYISNKVKDIPVAVVDNSKTPLSHQYTRYLDATEGIKVYTNGVDMIQARKLMQERTVRGIIFLPSDFSNKIYRGEANAFTMFGSTSSLLYYLTLQGSSTSAMLQINSESRQNIVNQISLEGKLALSQAPQADINSIVLYNKNGGYATFLMPVVLIVAFFQTMIMAIGVYRGGNTLQHSSNRRTILGFTSLYMLISCFVIGIVPMIFNLPNLGNPLAIFPFIFLFLIATALFGTLISHFLPDSESVNLIVPFFSVGLIFISGMSFPRESMPPFWQAAYYIFPSSPAITGYIKMNSMGAGIATIKPEIIVLLIQGAVYGTILYFIHFGEMRSAKAIKES